LRGAIVDLFYGPLADGRAFSAFSRMNPMHRAFLSSVRSCFGRSRIRANNAACGTRRAALNAAYSALRRRNSRSSSAENEALTRSVA